MDTESLMMWAKVILSGAVTLICVPLAVYFIRYYWDRRRWHKYEVLIRAWARDEFSLEPLADDEWKALAAALLSEAGFEPTKTKELIELAVWFGTGVATLELRGRLLHGDGDEKNE